MNFKKSLSILLVIIAALVTVIPVFAGECLQQRWQQLKDEEAANDKLFQRLNAEYKSMSKWSHSQREYARLLSEKMERVEEDLRRAREEIASLEAENQALRQQPQYAAPCPSPSPGAFTPSAPMGMVPRDYYFWDNVLAGYVLASIMCPRDWPTPNGWTPVQPGMDVPPCVEHRNGRVMFHGENRNNGEGLRNGENDFRHNGGRQNFRGQEGRQSHSYAGQSTSPMRNQPQMRQQRPSTLARSFPRPQNGQRQPQRSSGAQGGYYYHR